MFANPYKVLLFDWDGTLSDSASVIVSALRGASAAMDIPVAGEAELRGIIGLSLERAAQHLYGLEGHDAARFADAYRGHFHASGRPPIELFSGVRRTLETLSDAGFVLAVATGKGRAGLDRELAASQLDGVFELSRCADETQSKPHPQMVLEILTDTNCPANEALLVGDTDFDLMMANAAGVDALAVTCGNHASERLAACQPVAMLDDVAALPGWLAGRAM